DSYRGWGKQPSRFLEEMGFALPEHPTACWSARIAIDDTYTPLTLNKVFGIAPIPPDSPCSTPLIS
ncbi:MAG: hypothetical protein ACKVH0_16815, partial [Alphaproteobacteria bacterium]